MPKAPVVIHQYGRPVRAKLPNGTVVERQDAIYVSSYREVFKCLDYDTHFLYYDGNHIGSTLMCTCGSHAGVIGYNGYKRFASYQGPQVLACMYYTNNGCHADGSK